MKVQTRNWNGWLLPVLAAAAMFALVWGLGGVTAQTKSYSASLSGDQLVPPVSTSAIGGFTATYDADGISYTLWSDANQIAQAHIHLGAAGENGGVVAFLFGPADPPVDGINVSGTIGEGDILDGDLAALVAAMEGGNAYANVHTVDNPGGEVRRQIAVAAAGLPSTGTGGLAGTGSDSAIWIWALLAAGLTLTAGVAVRRVSQR